jgi:hypothetical protein
MITPMQAAELVGAPVHVQGGGRFGTVRRVLVDDGSGWPSWVLVDPGPLRSSHLVPLSVCYVDMDGVLTLPLEPDLVKSAPDVGDESGRVTAEDERVLYEHYGLEPGEPSSGPLDRPSGQVAPSPLDRALAESARSGSSPMPEPPADG